ncbi:MAG: MFS transporter [Pseudomonadota bacterium]|nr:MFS transporter [Pseudomonadota bacterium]
MSQQPSEILAQSRMSGMQIMAVTLCVLLNALDGFDVLSISFAAPGIAEEWNISRGALGIVLSMELIGMAVGSILLGRVADLIGRRPTIQLCLVVMMAGMFLVPFADGLGQLSVYRLLTGLGIGGMLASTNAMVAEYANARWRTLAVTIMAAGYPLGAIVGGSVSSMLLVHYDWRSVFFFGGAVTAVFLPVVMILLPESIEYLDRCRPRGALERINKTLKKMGHTTITALGDVVETQKGKGFRQLFGPALIRVTLLLTLAYFAHIMTFYFILKWIPKIVVDLGYVPSEAGGVLVAANIGGMAGSLLLGLLSVRFNTRWLVIAALGLAFAMVTYFGRGQDTLAQLALISAIAGFCTNSAVVGLYALFVESFPTEVRASGTGFVIGVGRGGAALGPIIAGFLFETGFGLSGVALVMASGSLVALVALLLLGRKRVAVSA